MAMPSQSVWRGWLWRRLALHSDVAGPGALVAPLVQKCLAFPQINRIEALGEPRIDRREEVTRWRQVAGTSILSNPHASKAHGRAQAPHPSLLLLCDRKRSSKHVSALTLKGRVNGNHPFTLQTMQ